MAEGYGVSTDAIFAHKKRNDGELIENKHFVIADNLSVKSSSRPATIFWTKKGIIRLGFLLKSERAKKFRDWAEDFVLNTAVSKPMTQLDILRAALDQIEAQERKQKEIDNRLLIVESKQETINEEYFAISGYYRLRGMRFNLTSQQAQIFGKRATSVSKDLGYTVGKAYHEKYGSVSTYHVDVLKVILGF